MTQSDSDVAPFLDPLKDVLAAFKEEYRDLSETWRHLDAKAQGAVATAGVFLAAAFAFVKSFTEGQLPSGDRYVLIATSALLVVSVALAVLALRIREITAAPVGARLEQLAKDLSLITTDEERRTRAPDFLGEQIDMWRDANTATTKANATKAAFVLASQVTLLLAVLAIAVLTITILAR